MELGKKMMKVCNGLPLAIVVLGGILRRKHTLEGWHSVHKNISSYLRMGYDHGRSCMDIILQSYTDLPYHLKPCFLHLASFPEDYLIETYYLYWMWVAEGLVKSSCDRTKSLEDVADDYLNDLAQAGLVEIVDRTSAGSIECVRLHDIVRDVCLETATTDNVLKVIDLRPGADQLQLNASVYYSSMRLLRLAVYLPEKSVNSSIPDSVSSKAHDYVRSLLFIAKGYKDEDRCQKLMANICNEFQMLRLLFLDNIKLGGKLTSKVGNLMHLRYLSLAGTEVSELPSSIGNLGFLEILDLRVFKRVKIPNTLWKLFRLRHLYLPYGGYDMKRSKWLRVDTLIWLEIVENLQVKNLRTKDLLKIKNLRRLTIKDSVSTEEEILDIIAAHKSFGRRGSCFLHVEGDVISKKPNVLSSFPCNLDLCIDGPVMKDVEFPPYLETLYLDNCQFEHDPMRMLGNLCHLRCLKLLSKSYVGKKMSCHSYSFPALIELEINGLENLEVWELEHGSMPKLMGLWIRGCINLNGFPDVLPSSLKSFYVDLESVVVTVDPYSFTNWLYNEVSEGGYEKVVSWGKGDAGMATQAKQLYHNRYGNRHFDVVARTCIPRRTLQRLLRDLNPRRIGHEELSKLSSDNLRAEIQQFMQQNKCLVILEEVDHDCLQDLDSTFGIIHGSQDFQSKLVITTTSAAAHADFHGLLGVFKLRPPTKFETWRWIQHSTDYKFVDTNAGITWNMLRHCFDHPLSTDLLVRLWNMKENIADWATRHEELADSNSLQFSHIFALCYSDLPLHLMYCLIYVANFPVDVEIPTKKLYQMWIAAGFVGLNHNDDAQTEESIACSYLTELVQRGMITVLKEGPDKRAKTCRLKLGLRDVCLEKAREEHILMIADQSEHTTSASTPKFRTQQLALHLDQISPSTPVSLDEHLISLNFSCSPTSLLIFPNVSDPLYKEEKWEWFIYICEHFQSLWVLDLERMWMTKGSLPKEVGNLGQLRYLSLRGTWVSQLPPSIESLWSLQTLDLRVMESIIIPDVLWKLNCLEHLYLPDQFIAQETAKLRLHGLNFLQTVVNLHTDKVCLNDLLNLKLLRKISIRKIHATDVVDELDNVLKHLSTSLDLCINSEIINDDQTILSRFKNMRKLKIKGMLLVRLHPKMFPTQLEELTLKHTKLEEDPLPVLEKLLQLRSLVLDHESFLGKTMVLSKDFPECTTLTLCSLSTLEHLYFPRRCKRQIVIIDCCTFQDVVTPKL